MNSRERFHETIRFGSPDRVPYFEEGAREDVWEVWKTQGLPEDVDPDMLFVSERREELMPDLYPSPDPLFYPTNLTELDAYRRYLDADDPRHLPQNLDDLAAAGDDRDFVVMCRVHNGFFLSMGVEKWDRFLTTMYLLADDPHFVKSMMMVQAEFNAAVLEKILRRVPLDAAIFSEPIGGNDRPLLSPDMYEEFVVPSYEPLFRVLRKYSVSTLIFRTYANVRLLLPEVVKAGFTCLWACETNINAMNYLDIRREFGRKLSLIGGLDLDALRQGKEAIRQELELKVPPLLEDGGYIPLADGRIRADVNYENYVYYRRLLRRITSGRQNF